MHSRDVIFANPSGGYLRRLRVGILNRLGVFIHLAKTLSNHRCRYSSIYLFIDIVPLCLSLSSWLSIYPRTHFFIYLHPFLYVCIHNAISPSSHCSVHLLIYGSFHPSIQLPFLSVVTGGALDFPSQIKDFQRAAA